MTVLSSSLLSMKTARFSLKDSAKTLSSICMFWAFAPKRYKGKNIFGFDSTFCGDCLGNGHADFIKQVLDDILEHVGLPKPLLLTWLHSRATKRARNVAERLHLAIFGNEKGLRCR